MFQASQFRRRLQQEDGGGGRTEAVVNFRSLKIVAEAEVASAFFLLDPFIQPRLARQAILHRPFPQFRSLSEAQFEFDGDLVVSVAKDFIVGGGRRRLRSSLSIRLDKRTRRGRNVLCHCFNFNSFISRGLYGKSFASRMGELRRRFQEQISYSRRMKPNRRQRQRNYPTITATQ